MATRATYTFTRDYNGPIVHIYYHWDGYPAGAAELLRNSKTAEQFLRNNDRAQICSSPEIHGDTEYHYLIAMVEGEVFVTAHDVSGNTVRPLTTMTHEEFVSGGYKEVAA